MRKNDETSTILTKKSGSEKIIYIIISIIFGVYAITIVYPLFYLLVNSFENFLIFNRKTNPFSLPEVWQFSNYVKAMTGMTMIDSMGRNIGLPEMFFNSIWYCVLTIGEGVFASTCTGYCISKYKFKCRSLLYGIAIFTMTIPIVGNMGSMFKITTDLCIYNSPLFVILSSCGGFGFNFLVMYGFFCNVSWNYAEAAFMDGASHLKVFFRVMLPQAFPLMITLSIVAFIRCWNDYMTPLLYIPNYPTVASGLYGIQKTFTRGGDFPSYYAGLVLSTLPVVAVFIAFSDTLTRNLSVGGLKG